jgi:hypothetical protein
MGGSNFASFHKHYWIRLQSFESVSGRRLVPTPPEHWHLDKLFRGFSYSHQTNDGTSDYATNTFFSILSKIKLKIPYQLPQNRTGYKII